MPVSRFSRAAFLAVLLSAPFATESFAQQDYPTRPIRLIVPYPPGGPTDLFARMLSERLGMRLRQHVVIDNRGGAATTIGAGIAARSAPDGYTLLIGTEATFTVNPVLTSKLSYDPVKDFAAISMLTSQPYLLAVNPSLPVNSVSQLVAYAKANPGKLSYASSGTGGGAQLVGEMFNHLAGTNIVHVPYKGAAPAILAVISGQVELTFAGISASYPQAVSGKVRALAVTSAKRYAAAPHIPTIAEGGIVDFSWTGFSAMVAPRGTPQHVIKRLNSELIAILNEPEFVQEIRKRGIEPNPGTPDRFAAYVKSEIARLKAMIKSSGLKIE